MSQAQTDPDFEEEIREGFETVGKKKPAINEAEFAALLRWLGQNPTGADVHNMMDGKATLTLEDVKQKMGPISEIKNADDIVEAFVAFDKDGRGFISASDLRHILTGMGDRLDEGQVESMLRSVGGEGQLNYRSFVEGMLRK